MVVAGTRPEFIKLAPVITGLQQTPNVDLIFIHSGQHFDEPMSRTLIQELGLPEPLHNFGVGGKSDPQQIATTLAESESVIRRYEPELILAEGDTNTVVAVAVAAAKVGVPFGHVEAGLRSFDRTMPEEINRVVADSCSDLCFCPTEISAVNLCREGILPDRIHITGNTIVDACKKHLTVAFAKSNILNEFGLNGRFGLVTVHRKENVDSAERLSQIIDALCALDELDLVFTIHPRTQRRLDKSLLWQRVVRSPHIIPSKPLGYLDFLKLLMSSLMVLTDSGGVQEEALTLRVPCLTLRENTERPETVIAGGNKLVGTRKEGIVSAVHELLSDPEGAVARIAQKNPLGDGEAGARIAKLCADYCEGSASALKNRFRDRELNGLTSLLVREEHHGTTVEEFCNGRGDVAITMVYDGAGNARFPRADLRLERGWLVCLLGNPTALRITQPIATDVPMSMGKR